MDTDEGDGSQPRDEQTYAIIGAAMAVHKDLGAGFLEGVYQEALAIETEVVGIPCKREFPIEIRYRGRVLTTPYRADFLCYDAVIVELKALDKLAQAHWAQVIHYLKATGFNRALLLNFGSTRLEYKRFVFNLGNENR